MFHRLEIGEAFHDYLWLRTDILRYLSNGCKWDNRY